jgi:prepilin-type processing-associated H-X9-DG protein
MGQFAGVDFASNWDWGVRADDFAAAYAKRERMAADFELAQCPADKAEISTPLFPQGDGMRGSGDPADPVTGNPGTSYWGYLSFGINEDIVGTEFLGGSSGPQPAVWRNGHIGEQDPQAGLRLRGVMDKVFQPSTCLLLTDSGPNRLEDVLENDQAYDYSRFDGYANLITSAKAPGPWLEMSVRTWFRRIPTKRHPGGAINVTFADFHAQTVKPLRWYDHPTPGVTVPAKFNAQVRVSPYRPFEREGY